MSAPIEEPLRPANNINDSMSSQDPTSKRESQTQKAGLMSLPSEVRLEMLRSVLVLPYQQSRVFEDISRPRSIQEYSDEYFMNNSLVEYTTFQQIRQRLQPGDCSIFPQILRTCRTISNEGQEILSENHLVKLITSEPISIRLAVNFNLSLWEVPATSVSQLIPLMTMNCKTSTSDSGRKLPCLPFRTQRYTFHVEVSTTNLSGG